MRFRVDDLAARSGLSVDTVRFYQNRGLLPGPQREGRLAWYSEAHLDRLRRIRDLKDKGFTLDFIRRVLDRELDPVDSALVDAVAAPVPGEDEGPERPMTLEELAERTEVPVAVLQVIEREGLLAGGESRGGYTAADARAVSSGLTLLEAGLPLSELLALARRHDAAMRAIAEQAVDVFVRFVRDPIRASESSDEEGARRIVDSFHKMLPATTSLVAYHFRRQLLAVARARMEREGLGDRPPTESS
jgi:DNA-binding transcriptional MerR regulator